MRIGFIGNTNNLPYMIARELASLGHQIFFVVDKEQSLHRPEAYYPRDPAPTNLEIYDATGIAEKYIHYLTVLWRDPRLRARLKSCDAVIANGLWAIAARSTGKPYLVLLTGSDLASVADPDALFHDYWAMAKSKAWPLRTARLAAVMLVGWSLRTALRHSSGFSYYARGVVPRGDALLARIFRGLAPENAPVRMALQFTDVGRLQPTPPTKNADDSLTILLAARHTWREGVHVGVSLMDFKGSDVFIRGLALFRAKATVAFCVRMFEKGLDVAQSKTLIDQLGLTDCVEWSSEVTQAQLLERYQTSDVIVDQFGDGVIAMAGLDAMAMGKPLLANGRPEIFDRLTGEKSPVCHATTPQEVCRKLLWLCDPQVRLEVGLRSRTYVERHFSSAVAARACLDVLEGGAAT